MFGPSAVWEENPLLGLASIHHHAAYF